MKNSESVVAGVIRGETINLDEFENPKGVYDFLNYYEMNMYAKTSNEDLATKISCLNAINENNSNIFEEQMEIIREELVKNDISYCILVGIPFTKRYHNGDKRRFQEDIDYFVSERDMEAINKIMVSLGYHRWNVDDKKKHITYINEGKTGQDTSRNGRCAVKFYRRLTDPQYTMIGFDEVKQNIEEYEGYRVLIPEMALLHLILHTHYYDFHPKIMCDIYAIISSGIIDIEKFYDLADKFGVMKLTRIVFGVLDRIGFVSNDFKKEDVQESFICDILASKKYWEAIFTRLDKNELTLLRCYLFNETDYRERFNKVKMAGLERRVSPMREEFIVK